MSSSDVQGGCSASGTVSVFSFCAVSADTAGQRNIFRRDGDGVDGAEVRVLHPASLAGLEVGLDMFRVYTVFCSGYVICFSARGFRYAILIFKHINMFILLHI